MNMYKYFPFMLFISFWLLVTPVSAQTIVYIPMDDRPVNLEYVVDTAQAAGVDIDNSRVEARLAARPPHRTGLALLRHPALHNSIYR